MGGANCEFDEKFWAYGFESILFTRSITPDIWAWIEGSCLGAFVVGEIEAGAGGAICSGAGGLLLDAACCYISFC